MQAVLVASLPQLRAGRYTEIIEVVADDCDEEFVPGSTIRTRTIRAPQTSYGNPSLTQQPNVGAGASSNGAVSVSQTGSGSSSVTTIINGATSIDTITLTSLPAEQSPTATSAIQPFPDTSGSINTALNTTNVVSSQPFVTSIPTISSNTLQPIQTTIPSIAGSNSTGTNTLTLPISTFPTTVTNITVTSIPVATSVTVTQVTVVHSTVTNNGSILTTSTVGTTVITTNGTVLTGTTVTGVSTGVGTLSTTITTVGSVTSIPTPAASCIVSMGCAGQDIFRPVGLTAPPSNIQQRSGHPVPRLGISDAGPYETNKFYANFYLGSQGSPAFVLPYSMTWSKGTGNAQSWGMSVQHIDDNQKVYGPPNTKIPGSPASYYVNPLGIQSVILSAAEFSSSTVMTTNSLQAFSVNVNLKPSAGSSSSISFPVVQGMGFVTGIYTNLQPAIQSSIFFRSVSAAGSPKSNIFKYRLTLEDGKIWLLYAIPTNGLTPNFQLVSSTLLQGVAHWSGTIQVAKVPDPSFEALYDAAAGAYPTSGSVSGYASGASAEYSLSWTKSGAYASNTTLLMYALPHHVASFSGATSGHVTGMKLYTPTKGVATAVVADYWSLVEDELPITMDFAPWRPGSQSAKSLSAAAISAIKQIAPIEASQNMGQQSNLDSMYYSGKALSKFASIIYTMKALVNQTDLANNALIELTKAFQVFTDNRQQYPLLYDTDWKGIVSSATYKTGDNGVDFGNSLYNDHHFHYGYFIHAAAIIGSYNATWLAANKDYVNALVRDVSNPSSLDQYFPVSRSFDWYNGHSWAKGLYESGDGKDEESSSEDAMFAYALKMWGKTTGDQSMEYRGNLMLSILARSLQSYFLLASNNKNQPSSFIGNKVTGIMFENKVDHTTYFGGNLEYIQGIHMIPLQPFSTLTRTTSFVMEEWNTYFANGAVAQAASVVGGWKGILYANLAIINPTAAYNFFTQPNFDPSWLDGGASRTWYIALAAGLGGSP